MSKQFETVARWLDKLHYVETSERTCHDTGENDWHFVCSACGYEQNGYEQWNYCRNCGAENEG